MRTASTCQLRLMCNPQGGLAVAHGKSGQALLEMLVAVLALAMLWASSAWLGRAQDMALQASHTARHAAFTEAIQAEGLAQVQAHRVYFDQRLHRWQDRRGDSLLGKEASGVSTQLHRLAPIGSLAQPAPKHPQGPQLREQWQLADQGVLRASVSVTPHSSSNVPSGAAKLPEGILPTIRRQAYILKDAGQSHDDISVQQRLAQAELAWGQAAGVSYDLSERLTASLMPVDRAWRRPAPEAGWLHLWQDWVPADRLSHIQGRP